MDYQEKTVLLKNGRHCTIRRGEESDAEILLAYQEITAAETPYMTRTPEESVMSLEEEREIIREKNREDDALNLLAFVDGRHAGNCAFNPADDTGPLVFQLNFFTLIVHFFSLYSRFVINKKSA